MIDPDLDRAWAPRCPDCGRDRLPGEAFVALFERIHVALKGRRLIVPDSVYADLRLAQQNAACRCGLCLPGSEP